MASATGLIKSADPDGEHMLVCITREWMLETLKDKEKMNQWYPAVRHEAILWAAELTDPGVLFIYVLYLISHSLMSSKRQICLMSYSEWELIISLGGVGGGVFSIWCLIKTALRLPASYPGVCLHCPGTYFHGELWEHCIFVTSDS